MPFLGLGTAGIFSSTQNIVRRSLEYGVRLIDSAQAAEWYDEAALGEMIKQYLQNAADDVYIVTKLHPRSYGYEAMKAKLAESAANFGSHHVDVMLLHAPFCWSGHCTAEEEKITWIDGWRHLESLKDHFRIRFIGVSNVDIEQVRHLVLQVAQQSVSVIQNWMDPFHQDKAVRSFCKEHGITYMAYSSFGTQWGSGNGVNNIVMTDRTLMQIARNHDTSVPQVILAWLMHEGVVAIPRSSHTRHLQENFSACQQSDVCTINGSAQSYPLQLTMKELEDIRGLDGLHGDPWN